MATRLLGLLDWLSDNSPREATPEAQLEMVKPAVLELQGRPLARADRVILTHLLAVLDLLNENQPVDEELEQFFVDYGHLRHENEQEQRPAADWLESDLATIANRLPRWEWNTELYAEFAQAAEELRTNRGESAEGRLDDVEERVLRVWRSYCEVGMEETELTAESIVGHRILKRGVAEWLEALNCLRSVIEGEGDLDEGLEHAEQANRLLVAVQKFGDRIERQTRL